VEERTRKRIAILATDGVEQDALLQPMEALIDAGAKVDVASTESGDIQGIKHDRPSGKVAVDLCLDEARSDDFDGEATDVCKIRYHNGRGGARRPLGAQAKLQPAGGIFPFAAVVKIDRPEMTEA
jgi:DJ-1/PfpI family